MSLPLIFLYILSMFVAIKIYTYGFASSRTVLYCTFYTGLVLLGISMLIGDWSKRFGDILILLALILLGIYSYARGLTSLASISLVKHYVIPPAFIYIPCSIEAKCDNYATLAIDVPLAIVFSMFIYGVLGLIGAGRTGKAKEGRKVDKGFHTEVI